jgi:hypothetical protein
MEGISNLENLPRNITDKMINFLYKLTSKINMYISKNLYRIVFFVCLILLCSHVFLIVSTDKEYKTPFISLLQDGYNKTNMYLESKAKELFSPISQLQLQSEKMKRLKNEKRILNELSESNLTHSEFESSYNYHLLYEFIKNVTNFNYIGEWSNLKFPSEDMEFENDKGDVHRFQIINFPYNKTMKNDFLKHIETENNTDFVIYLFDGHYYDNEIKLNFSLTLQSEGSNNSLINQISRGENEIVIDNSGVIMSYSSMYFLGELKQGYCNNTHVYMKFLRSPQKFKQSKEKINIIEYSEISVKIKDEECKIKVDLDLKIDNEDLESDRVWNYSLILTAISIAEIYYIIKLIYQVDSNAQIGKNICLITLSINIIWNSFICTIHFYLSITQESYSYEYGTPSMTYFLLFSLFELRLLFFVWKSRYQDLLFTDPSQFRKKLFKFYSAFCNHL